MTTPNPLSVLAERIGSAWAWLETWPYTDNARRRWIGPKDGDVMTLYRHDVTHIHLDEYVKVRLSYDSDNRFDARLVFFPPTGPPTLTAREIAMLHVADMATEGMLTSGAINANDNHLLGWLRLPPTGSEIPKGESPCL